MKFSLVVVFIFQYVFSVNAQPAEHTGFKQRGFYLHGGWYFNYPFSVKTWNRADYAGMFRLLQQIGYTQVMLWPMVEAIPAPLSTADSMELVNYKSTISDAQNAGLQCWVVQNANLTPSRDFGTLPWKQRVPYASWKQVRLDIASEAVPYLAHRKKIMSVINNADVYVTIDGDPGGYTGALPEHWLKVFLSDREVIDSVGTHSKTQEIVPWVWSGWGVSKVWGGNPNNPPALIKPFIQAEIDYLKDRLPGPWQLMPGRSHRTNWANGRVNVELADSLGLMNRSSIMCYEAIEFEPTPPASTIQFDIIRNVLRQEAVFATAARGVFGNAQQPVMVLPNLFFFAKAAADTAYLNKTDDAVLTDLATFLGGDPLVLIPAWRVETLGLEQLSKKLPRQLKQLHLNNANAALIPGGAKNYLHILSTEVDCRIRLLTATQQFPASEKKAVKSIHRSLKAIYNWWFMHHYVAGDQPDAAFSFEFVPLSHKEVFINWLQTMTARYPQVINKALERSTQNAEKKYPYLQEVLKNLQQQYGRPPGN